MMVGYCFVTVIFGFTAITIRSDSPCSVRLEEAGYVCVCNATYCDTVERPSPLPKGAYHRYTTAETSPGFTHTTGYFDSSSNREQPTGGISNDVFIWVNSSVKYQTFTGVGGGISDSVGVNFNNLPPGAKQNFIESFFGKFGIEYTFARVPIAGCDFSPRFYTYDDVPGDGELKYFNLTEEDYTYKIPLIRQAMQASERGLKLLASSWTSPVWMKTNNATRQGYLLKKYHETFARYHIKFLESYKELGIEYWGLTIGNELILALYFGSFFGMQNLVMMPYQANQWIKHYLGPTMKTNGFDKVQILTLDDERPFMTWWMNRTVADKEAAKYIDGIALHWYLDSNASLQQLDSFHNLYPDKYLLYTESSINSVFNGDAPFALGAWSRGVRYINNIYQNWEHWVSGYIDWNIALNEEGGPSYVDDGIKLDASVIVNASSGEFYKQPIFYVLGHFSKFILPGSQKVQVTIKQETFQTYIPNDWEVSTFEELKEKLSSIQHQNMLYNLPQPTPGTPPTGGTRPTGGPPPTGGTPPTGEPGPTRGPFPTRIPDPPSTTFLALASSNKDGSISLITYNPRTEPVNLNVQDPLVGWFNTTIEAHSLNTFVYWT